MVRTAIALVVLCGCAEVARSPFHIDSDTGAGSADASITDTGEDVTTMRDAASADDAATTDGAGANVDAGQDAAPDADDAGGDAIVDAGSDSGDVDDAGMDAQPGSDGGSGTGGGGGIGGDSGAGGDEDAGGDASPAQDAGHDAGCTPITVYIDNDRDGYGDDATQASLCDPPFPYIIRGGDCYDGNALAKPGQTTHYDVDRGDGSYDYDCDGIETPFWTAMSPCYGPGGVGGAEGWREACLQPVPGGCDEYRGVPDCGTQAFWITETGACPANGLTRRQRCR